MKRAIVIALTCFLLMTTIHVPLLNAGEMGNVSSNDYENLGTFALAVYPGCKNITLSWQDVYGVYEYKVLRDGKEVAILSSTEGVWIDPTPKSEESLYQVLALDGEQKIVSESWKIDAKTSCFEPELCKTVLKYQLGSTDYWVEGKKKGPMDTPPEINLGRMFLVIRYVTQELGAELSWDGAEKKVTITTKTGKIIDLWVGRPLALVDGASVIIDSDNMSVVPYIKEGRTLLPMRFVAEQLGADGEDDVIWEGETKSVTLKVRDEECPEPDVLCLTVVAGDSSKWLVKCIDSMRNDVYVTLNREYAKLSATLEPGQKVKTAGKLSIKDREQIAVEARWIKPVDGTLEEFICKPIKCDAGKMTFLTGDESGSEIELNYSRSFVELESLENSYFAKILVDENDNVVWWEPAVFEVAGEKIEPITHSVDFIETDQKMNRLLVKYDDGEIKYEDWIYFATDFEFDKLESTESYKITFVINDHGNRIAMSEPEEWESTTSFKLASKSPSLEVFPGAKFEVEFSLRNLSKNEATFKTVAVVLDDDGESLLNSDTHDVKPKYGAKIKEIFYAPSKETDFKFGLRVTTGTTSRTFWIDAKCIPLEFELKASRKNYEFHLNEPAYVSVEVTHKYDSPVHIVASLDVLSDAVVPSKKMSSQSIDVNPKVKKTINFPLSWDRDVAIADETYELKVTVRCKGNIKEQSITIKALDYIPPEIVISHIENDETRETSIYGSINWNDLTPDRVEIDWGDGTTTQEDAYFPFSHQYERWGSFMIKIKVFSEEGSTTKISKRFSCEEPPPPLPLVTSVSFDKEMPSEYTIKMEVEINWRDYPKGRIHIDWGDGESDQSYRTSFKHEYPDDTGSFIDNYIMTIKARTSDGATESPERKYKVTMIGGILCLFSEM